MQGNLHPEALVHATDIDVLPADRELIRRDGYWVIRSPGNPAHYWGNFLIFDAPPGPGDGARWEAIFTSEFDAERRHRAFSWNRTDGALGAAEAEFLPRGYRLEKSAGLVAGPEQLRRQPGENRDLDTAVLSADSPRWEGVVALQLDQNAHESDPQPMPFHEHFVRRRVEAIRALVRSGRAVWTVALDGDLVVGSLGVVVTRRRARYQLVDTRASHRRRGLAARLLLDAADAARALGPIDRFVIVADPEYHAIGLYERVGFQRREDVRGVVRWPT